MLIIYGLLMIASLILLCIYNFIKAEKKQILFKSLISKQIITDLKKIGINEDAYLLCYAFYEKKFKNLLFVICVVCSLSFLYEFVSSSHHELVDKNRIIRNDYLKEDKQVLLKIKNLYNDEQTKIQINVSERKYTKDQIEELSKMIEEEIYCRAISNNESYDYVYSNLDFPTTISGYPFSIAWRSDNPLILNSKGILNIKKLEEIAKNKDISDGILTGVHAKIAYSDYEKDIDFYVRIFLPIENTELTLSQYATEIIEEADDEQNTEEELTLPLEMGGILVEYEEISDNRSLFILLIGTICSIAVFYKEDEELKKKITERNSQMIGDYPGIVNKFVLFFSAGLTARGIWNRICRDYRQGIDKGKGKRYVYEEMLVTLGEMEEGVGEISAFDEFAKRCGLNKYRHFISIICQAMGKGREDLLLMLEKEAEDAFVERKNRAKELGEKAGTKLLFPMFLMLMIVLVIVMIPAFITFQM